MSLDTELEQWRGAWQSPVEVPADLRRRVERQARLLRIMLAGDILVTVVIGGGTILLAIRSLRPDMWLLAATTWLFIVAAWAFRLHATRGLWAQPATDTTSFIDRLIQHCRVQLTATVFAAVLFTSEIAFCLGWIHQHLAPRPPLVRWLLFSSVFIDLVWAGALVFFSLLIWYRRRKRAEMVWLQATRHSR